MKRRGEPRPAAPILFPSTMTSLFPTVAGSAESAIVAMAPRNRPYRPPQSASDSRIAYMRSLPSVSGLELSESNAASKDAFTRSSRSDPVKHTSHLRP